MVTPPPTMILVNAAQRFGATRKLVLDYSALLSGQLGRLVFSLIYFLTITRTLDLGDFGIFATGSAIGIVLSRLTGFGYISPLYRVATTKPLLIGAYTGGYAVGFVASLAPIAAVAWLLYALLYSELVSLSVFLLIVGAEVLFWRSLEMVIVVNNGLNRFLTGSMLAIAGVAAKAAAALAFYLAGETALADWAILYFATNGVVAVLAIALFYPRQRLRWRPRAWGARARDALSVSMAELLFYVQTELDKVLVLAFGGETFAGLYSIIMRLVDLTAMPLRAMSTMLTQWIMRARQAGTETRHGLLVDAAVGVVSVAGLLAIYLLLWLFPAIAGQNISMAVAYLPMIILVPAFRNIIEYHTDLLYAHERMAIRVFLLSGLIVIKAGLLALLLGYGTTFETTAVGLNIVFGILFIVSAWVTYARGIARAEVKKR